MAFVEQPFVVGNTIDFTINVKKDGVIWDISGGEVKLYLMKPDGTVLAPITATISNGAGGVAHHQVTESVLDVYGDWIRRWKISKGGVVLWTQDIEFSVLPSRNW